ncbi:uncharacterized protein LOC141904515 [Tubulanus polymorphus]|uniref:uncharacterized protein LOC141904515 n=1 Tax=Tubulanus polymorphus TaxID=672921 RepID=UPI003DA46E65
MAGTVNEDSFDRLTAHLLLKIQEYETLIKQCQEISSDCRSLFKPWTNKKSTEVIKVNQPEKLLSKERNVTKEKEENDKETQRKNEEEMKRVEELLVKAQKAREIQMKLEAKAIEKKQTPSITSAADVSIKKLKSGQQPLKSRVDEKENKNSKVKVKQQKPVKNFKPVHETAPFKTDSTSYKKRNPSYKKPSSAGKSLPASAAPVRNKNIVKNEISCISKQSVDNPRAAERLGENLSPVCTTDLRKQEVVNNVEDSVQANISNMLSNAQKNCSSDNVAGPCEKQECDDEKPFLLVKDGQDLIVPSKVKKLFMKNYKLRQEILKLNRATDEISTPEFFLNVEKYISEDRFSSIQRLIFKLTKSYDLSHRMIEGTCPPSITDSLKLSQLLRTKSILEKSLLFIAESEKQYRTLNKECRKFISSSEETVEVCSRVEKYFAENQTTTNTADYSANTTLMYTKPQHLYQYSHIQSKLDILHNESALFDYSNDLLQRLKKLDVTDCDAACIYRSLYSLLCTKGRHFPILIADYGFDEENSGIEENSDS